MTSKIALAVHQSVLRCPATYKRPCQGILDASATSSPPVSLFPDAFLAPALASPLPASCVKSTTLHLRHQSLPSYLCRHVAPP
ncbi:hypothetical protein NL676_035423 [Syzygium grande]|nr:hypothetical protein NL676_035423 [Syzygium grande]